MIAPKSWLNQLVDLSSVSDQKFSQEMTFAGNKVEVVKKEKGETVFEFEITSNRPDTLSIIGLAREAATIFNNKLKLPSSAYEPKVSVPPVKLTITNKKLCPAYSLISFAKVKVKPSSPLIKKRLELCQIRPVNNVVDITNYLMQLTGQPMHAFDADQLLGKLTLRAAKKGEEIIPLDHQKRALSGGEIIIEDEEKLIDLAGLMGGENSEVSDQTTKVLLLVPIYDPTTIRQASKTHKLRTEASTRFEKQLDLTQTEMVAQMATELIEKETGGSASSRLVSQSSAWKPTLIQLNEEAVETKLGLHLSEKEITNFLDKVEIAKTKDGYQPPAWRRDLTDPVDLVEEVARLYGYNQFRRTLPVGNIPVHQTALQKNWVRKIKNIVASLGYFETYSSTLISQSVIEDLDLEPKDHLKVLHPMSADFEYMRTSISQSLLPVLKYNLLTQTEVNLFELGTVFKPIPNASQLPLQPLELGLLSTSVNFPKFKGQLKVISNRLNLPLEVVSASHPHPGFHPSHQALVKLENKPIGLMAQTKDKQAWLLTVDVSALISLANDGQKYPEVSGYPPIIEDLTFTLPPRTLLGPVLDTIKSTDPLITLVELTKTYRQNYTFHLIYQSLHKPLTDEGIAPIRKKVVANLRKQYKAELVGYLK